MPWGSSLCVLLAWYTKILPSFCLDYKLIHAIRGPLMMWNCHPVNSTDEIPWKCSWAATHPESTTKLSPCSPLVACINFLWIIHIPSSQLLFLSYYSFLLLLFPSFERHTILCSGGVLSGKPHPLPHGRACWHCAVPGWDVTLARGSALRGS